MHLDEITAHIIDVKRSAFDKEKSDPAKGKFVWQKKVFVSYKNPETRPKFRFVWAYWNGKNDWGVADYMNKWNGCSFVEPQDGYVPMGATLNADNHYVYKDVVLMKVPIEEYISQRKKEIMESEKRPQVIKGMLRDEYRNAGVSLSEQELDHMLG
jgi:hypothetical protein